MMNYIDLFSGSGGLTLGFEKAGFKNIFSLDNNKDFNSTYKLNFPKHKLVEKNIEEITNEELVSLTKGKKIDVIVGGPPCQGFSMAGNIGRKFIDDPRNHLFNEFARVVEIVKPDYFIMENVARLFSHNKNKTRKEIIDKFNSIGYEVIVEVLNAVDYAVPQNRRRVIFFGTRLSTKLVMPIKLKSKHITVGEVLNDLPKLNSGESSKVPNHVAMNHSEQMLEKMSYIKDGGDRLQIPEKLRPQSGDVRKYIKYDSGIPSVCITGDMRKVFHPKYNRALTVRELARIQTYPDTFIFSGSKISQQQQVGNSVPPMLGYYLAKNLKSLKDYEKKS